MTTTEDEPKIEDVFLDPRKEELAKQLAAMSEDDRMKLIRLARPRIGEPYTAHIPHPAQQVFLNLNNREAMYGGAAGGGKSDALLMAALQYVDVPGYSALILRRTWPDLNAPGAILDRAKSWFAGTPAKPTEGGRIWTFPCGDGKTSRLQFGYINHDKDKYKFQSAEYQFIGFDELTHFEDTIYHYLFSRCRRPAVSCLNCSGNVRRYVNKKGSMYWKHTEKQNQRSCTMLYPDPMVLDQYSKSEKDGLEIFDVPLRVRSATNPGGIGHLWVKEYFIDEKTRNPKGVFVPARLTDNPSLDRKEYEENLSHLLPVDRERLLNGDWDVDQEGALFQRHWFNVVNQPTLEGRVVRYWDLAATTDGDYSCGALLRHLPNGRWQLQDMVRFRGRPHEVEKVVYSTALSDGAGVPIVMEQEPGSSGVNNISHYRRNILAGFTFKGVTVSGSKEQRAYPVASAAEAGNFDIVKAEWNKDFIDEAALFPGGANDDQIDATSGAMGQLAFGRRTRILN